MTFTMILTISLILFTRNIIITLKTKCDNNMFFYILSIIILSSSLYTFWIYYNNLTFSLIVSLLLMIITFMFILELKNNYHQNIKYMIPYFIITIYIFSKIINSFLLLAHQ